MGDTAFLKSIKRRQAHQLETINTAHHEAGHTIFALLQGMIVYSVCIFTDKTSNRVDGFTHYFSLELTTIVDPFILNNRVEAELGMEYAGMMAERHQYHLHTGSDKCPSFLKDGSSADIKRASDLIKKYQLAPAGQKRYRFKQRIMKKVLRQLQEHWGAVIVVAHALFRKKRLTGEEVQTLLTTQTDNKDFWKKQYRMIQNLYAQPYTTKEQFLTIIEL
jgi:hypothetical protein